MKDFLDLRDFQIIKGELCEVSHNRARINCKKQEIGRLMIEGKPGEIGGIDWSKAKYMVADVICYQDWSLVFMFEFWEEDNTSDEPNMTIRMSLLPNIKTRLVLPLEALDSQRIFLPRTPGKLRSFVHGKKVDVNRINRCALSVREGFEDQYLEICDVYLTNVEPDYPLPDVKLVDELGQLSTKDWPGKTSSVEEMKENLEKRLLEADNVSYPAEWSKYGGWIKKKFESKGYFSIQHDGRRWWMVDPDGYAFFSIGLDCVRTGEEGPVKSIDKFFSWIPSEDGEFKDAWVTSRWFDSIDKEQLSFANANLIRAFGDKWVENWSKITKANLIKWGFNTIGNWSDPDFIEYSKMPYVLPLRDFPTTQKKIFRDFPDVFSMEYEINAKKYAKQLEPYVNDKHLIGYFLRNEPEWAFTEDLEIAEELLDTDIDYVTKDKFIEYISKRYDGDVNKLNKAWNISFSDFTDLRKRIRKASSLSEIAAKDLNDFSRIMIEKYVKVPSLAVKSVDPHHLNLGMRYAFILYENQTAGKEYFDVFSINCYKIDPSEVIAKTVELIKMPIMIGEFHFGALDRGLQATGIIGVANQEERGKAYQCYVENSASFPECVGTHYFMLNDQPTLGRPDGENYQIGLVDVCHRPYEEFIKGIIKTHKRLYDVADGRIEKEDVRPIQIKSNIAS
jgi:hypothetical protein